jgi:hypothetical protein
MVNNVLCIVSSGPQTLEILSVVKVLDDNKFKCFDFLFEREYETAEQNREVLIKNGYNVYRSDGSESYTTNTNWSNNQSINYNYRAKFRTVLQKFPVWFSDSLTQLIRYILYTQLISFPYWYLRYRRHLQKCRSILKDKAPKMVILAVDAAHYDSGSWIKACYELGIPSVLIPFGMADKEALADDRVDLIANSCVLLENKLLGMLYPQWVYKYKGKRIVELPAAQALAKQMLSVVMNDPWTYNGSNANKILLESEFAKAQLLEQSKDLKNIEVTGRIAHDEIREVVFNREIIRNEIAKLYNFNSGKPIVTAALTPDKFAIFGHMTEFDDYITMIKFWVDVLSSGYDIQILISVHPSDSPENVRFLEKENVCLTSEPLTKLISISDIYVTDCSATSRLAVICGVPVMDYDLYRFNLKFNKVGDGLIYVDNKEDFIKEWKRIWRESGRLEELHAFQESKSSYFANLDGCAEKRISNCINNMMRLEV